MLAVAAVVAASSHVTVGFSDLDPESRLKFELRFALDAGCFSR